MVNEKSFLDNAGNSYKVKGTITCTTYNVVYGIYCETCKKIVYVGETGNNLYQRHQLNLSRIRTGRNLDPLTSHFRSAGHGTEDYKILGIERITKDEEYRKARELFWIKKINTIKPNGLNTKEY